MPRGSEDNRRNAEVEAMTDFSTAMQQAEAGNKMARPHWHWLYVSRDERGKLSLFNDDDERQALFRATRGDKRADDWQPYGGQP